VSSNEVSGFFPRIVVALCCNGAIGQALLEQQISDQSSLNHRVSGQMEIRPCDDEGVVTFSESCRPFAARSALEGNVEHRLRLVNFRPQSPIIRHTRSLRKIFDEK
jgi:hypothetical protein